MSGRSKLGLGEMKNFIRIKRRSDENTRTRDSGNLSHWNRGRRHLATDAFVKEPALAVRFEFQQDFHPDDLVRKSAQPLEHPDFFNRVRENDVTPGKLMSDMVAMVGRFFLSKRQTCSISFFRENRHLNTLIAGDGTTHVLRKLPHCRSACMGIDSCHSFQNRLKPVLAHLFSMRNVIVTCRFQLEFFKFGEGPALSKETSIHDAKLPPGAQLHVLLK